MQLFNGDCLEVMKSIPDKSIDAIITDPPYGTTACKWDSVIPFDLMWEQLNRIIKDNGTIVLFGSEPFSSSLRMSNIKNYKYDWVWIKNKTVGFTYCKTQPLRNTENILIFQKETYGYQNNIDGREYFNNIKNYIGKSIKQINEIIGNRFAEHCFYYKSKQFNLPNKKTYEILTDKFNLSEFSDYLKYDEMIKKFDFTYNAQGLLKKDKPKKVNKKDNGKEWVYNTKSLTGKDYIVEFENYPRQTIFVDCETKTLHSTQKPVALIEYLIKTYTNENETVLDFTMGSGTTGVACKNLNRKFIGIELDKNYFEIAKKRIEETPIKLF
jgi:DNA modification methylase